MLGSSVSGSLHREYRLALDRQNWRLVGRSFEIKSEQGSEFGSHEEMVVLCINLNWVAAMEL